MTLVIAVDVDFTEEEIIKKLEEETPNQPPPRDGDHILIIHVGLTDKEYRIDSGDSEGFTMVMMPKK